MISSWLTGGVQEKRKSMRTGSRSYSGPCGKNRKNDMTAIRKSWQRFIPKMISANFSLRKQFICKRLPSGWIVSKCLSALFEQVGMDACIEEKQIQFFVILLPNHQPIRFNVAFPLTIELSVEFMWPILSREGTCFCKDADGLLNMRQVQAPLLTEFQILLESVSEIDAVHTMPEPA